MVLNARTGELLNEISELSHQAAFSFDNTHLISGNGTVWDYAARRTDRELKLNTNFVKYSPASKLLVFWSELTSDPIQIWDATTYSLISTLQKPSVVRSLDFSLDGKKIVIASGNDEIIIWNIAIQERIVIPGNYYSEGSSIAFAPAGNEIAIGGYNTTVWIRNIDTTELLHVLEYPDPSNLIRIVYSPNGKHIVANSGGNLYIWNIDSPEGVRVIEQICSFALSNDGKILATSNYYGKTVISDFESGEIISVYFNDSCIHDIVFSSDGKNILGIEDDEILNLTISPKSILTLPYGRNNEYFYWLGLRAIAFNPKGDIYAVAGAGNTEYNINVWAYPEYELLFELNGQTECYTCSHYEGGVEELVFSPDGRILISLGTDGTLILWDVQTGDRLITIEAGKLLKGVVFSPDGGTIIGRGRDGIHIYGIPE